MKILWVSNAPWTKTGYGRATDAVTAQMAADGHEIHIVGCYGIQGGIVDLEDGRIVHPPSNYDLWGNDVVADYHAELGTDFVLIHRDIWVNDSRLGDAVPLAAWFPVDQEPLGANTHGPLGTTRWPATMSRWGQRVAKDAGFAVDYLPHSFDPASYFYGRAPEKRAELFGGAVPEDAFLISIVAANKGFPSRKAWPEMLEAAAVFLRDHDDAYLYLHTNVTHKDGGPDLLRVLSLYNAPMNRVVMLHPFIETFGFDDGKMGDVYRASDVLLNTSYAEGFGIPILEAQACGTPVIVTEFSAMPEILFNGHSVVGQAWMNANYGHWMVPDVEDIRGRLELVRASKGTSGAEERSQEMAAVLAEEWTHTAVYQSHWKPWLGRIAAELGI